MEKIVAQGRLLFGIAMAALGVENFVCARVAQPIFVKSPPAIPVLPFVPGVAPLAYLAGAVLLFTGLAIAVNIRARIAAILLALFLLSCVVVPWIPRVARAPLDLNIRTCIFETLAVAASALTLAGCLTTEDTSRSRDSVWLDRLIASGPCFFAGSSIVFGITHFLILRFIASLVPAWIPGGLFWAYLTGAAFVAAGLSIATGVAARWGAFLLGIMFLLWFLLLHAPRVMIRPHNPSEWSSALIALGMSGGSWICAWHFVRRRKGRNFGPGTDLHSDPGTSDVDRRPASG